MTAGDVVNAALRILGVLASGEAPSGSESADGLSALNRMIDSWSNEQMLIPNKVREVFALTLNQQTFTMGTGGNFNTSRAQKIENALIQITGTSPLLEIPMTIYNQDQYSSILLKTLTSNFPLFLYRDGAYPLDNISVWPVANTACSLVLYSWKPLSTLAALATALSLPPGYEEALVYNLSVRLAPEYGRTLAAEAVTIAVESRAAIKRMNTRTPLLQVDDALRPRPSVFNWRTGEPT